MKIISIKKEKVILSNYHPSWKKIYEKEKGKLLPLDKMYGLGIEHIGSTAIPGSKAKPIIDIAIGVKKLKDGEKLIKPLKKLGYECRHDSSIEKRYFFYKGKQNSYNASSAYSKI